jgi:phage virion morphogenesis protein
MITITVTGFERAQAQILHYARFDKHRLLTVLGNLLRTQTIRHFQYQAGPAGPFAPWRPSTAARRSGGMILSDTGRLRGSISALVGMDQVEAGTNVQYGKYHQKGTRKMVARPFMGLTQQDEQEIHRVIAAFLAASTGALP